MKAEQLTKNETALFEIAGLDLRHGYADLIHGRSHRVAKLSCSLKVSARCSSILNDFVTLSSPSHHTDSLRALLGGLALAPGCLGR